MLSTWGLEPSHLGLGLGDRQPINCTGPLPLGSPTRIGPTPNIVDDVRSGGHEGQNKPSRLIRAGRVVFETPRSGRHPPGDDLGGEIITWAPAVPGYMSHGLPGPIGATESPVDSTVAHGM